MPGQPGTGDGGTDGPGGIDGGAGGPDAPPEPGSDGSDGSLDGATSGPDGAADPSTVDAESRGGAEGAEPPAGPTLSQGTGASSATANRLVDPQTARRVRVAGHALARQPDSAVAAAQYLQLVGVSSAQGRRTIIPLGPECAGVRGATIDGLDQPIDDLDDEPMTFTLDAVVPDLGTRTISFACDDGEVTGLDLFVYRQTGTTRGGMALLALLATIGVLAATAIAALSGLVPSASTDRDERPPWLPS